jgi:hypothetical protein
VRPWRKMAVEWVSEWVSVRETEKERERERLRFLKLGNMSCDLGCQQMTYQLSTALKELSYPLRWLWFDNMAGLWLPDIWSNVVLSVFCEGVVYWNWSHKVFVEALTNTASRIMDAKDHKSYSGLDVCPFPDSCWNFVAMVTVLPGNIFKKWLDHGGSAIINRLMHKHRSGVLIKEWVLSLMPSPCPSTFCHGMMHKKVSTRCQLLKLLPLSI